MGVTNFNNRNIAQNHHLLNKHFSGILVLKLMLAVIYVLVTFCVALIMNYRGEELRMLAILCFNQFLISFILYLRSNISGLLFFRTDSFLSVLDRFLMILICSVLIWGHVTSTPFQIIWFVYAQTAAYLVTALVAFLIVVEKSGFKKLSWSWPFIILIIKKSLPFALLFLLMAFNSRMDPVMLGLLLPGREGHEQAGIYASGFRILDAVNMIAYLFSVLLIPIFSKMLKNRESIEKMLKLSFTMIITLAVIVSMSSLFYSTELMALMYREHVEASSQVFSLLITSFIAISTSYIFSTLLTSNGNMKILNGVAFCGVIINIGLNIFLVPRMLAMGSAVAALVTQFTVAILHVIFVQRTFRFKVNYPYLLTLFLFIVGVITFSMLSKLFVIPVRFVPKSVSWLPNYFLMLLLSAILAGILRLLNFGSLIRILKGNGP
jgi:O-antigen/teichoic acid export membrane protein